MDGSLFQINKSIYAKIGLQISDFNTEVESTEYDASRFRLGNRTVYNRTAKITPEKIGQFVTFWKRSAQGPITPFDEEDYFDFLTVTCTRDELFGQFVFPKNVLIQKGILSTMTKEDKRAFRVYPSWDTPTSKQALKTQEWQEDFFYTINKNLDIKRVKTLFHQN